MQIVQHERGLCVKSFHVFWQTCVFPDFSDWSPHLLTVTRAQKPKKTAPVAMRTMSVVRFTSCSCSWASASKKKKKKLNKNQIFTQIYEKNRLGMEYMQVSMWRPPKLYTLASWCLSRHFSFFFFLFFDIFLSGNIFSILARIYVSYLKNWHEGKKPEKQKGQVNHKLCFYLM